MRFDVAACEVLALDSGVFNCPVTGKQLPAMFVTVRVTGQGVVNLAIRNPRRLLEDVPKVIGQSRVLTGDGEFVPEDSEDDQ